MSRSAAILLADPDALARLRQESGLLHGFLGVFDGNLDDTVRDDERGLDHILHSHAVVAIDRGLLLSRPAPRPEDALRRNLVAKVDGLLAIHLVVCDKDEASARESLEQLAATGVIGGEPGDSGAHRRAVLVIVLSCVALTARMRRAIDGVLRSGRYRAVYLMTEVLQRAREVVVRADHVWPIQVGRLLVALGARDDAWWASWDNPEPRLLLWRTVAWGTDGAANGHADPLERAFFDRLQSTLLPTAGASVTPFVTARETQAVADRDAERPPPAIAWGEDPESYDAAVQGEIGDRALVMRTIEHGADARPQLVAKEIADLEHIDAPVSRDWRAIGGGGEGGGPSEPLAALQRLAETRPSATGGPEEVEGLHDRARERVSRRLLQLDAIKRRRDRLVSEATPTLTLARAKFVPLWWRGLIGVAVTLSVLALLLGILVPLRPKPREQTQGSSFMGVPLRERSVAFLVDRSGSMAGPRIEKLKADLTAAIESLPAGAKFTVAAFSSDTVYLPGGENALVAATHASRQAAADWISTLKAEGSTLAAEGLQRLVGVAPSEIVLLTDGAIGDAAKVEEIVASLGEDTKLRINTIAFYGDSGEDFLRQISEATSGSHTFIAFDPFDPPGFPWVLALVVAATALGACCGVFLPWFLERRAGLAGAKVLSECVQAARADHEAQLNEGRAIVASIADILRNREQMAVGAFQRSLGGRALQIVRGLFAAAGTSAAAGAGRRAAGYRGRLWEEDRREIRRILDVPLDGWSAGELDADEAITGAVSKAAADLRAAWLRICTEHDSEGPCGHVPALAIIRDFGAVLRHAMGTWPLMILLRRRSIQGLRSVDGQSVPRLASDVGIAVGGGGNHPDLLSAPIDQSGATLLSECRRWQWIELTKGQVVGAVEAIPLRLPDVYQRMRVERVEILDQSFHRTLFDSTDGHTPAGVAALGLIHEEIRIRIVSAVDSVDAAPGRSESHGGVGGTTGGGAFDGRPADLAATTGDRAVAGVGLHSEGDGGEAAIAVAEPCPVDAGHQVDLGYEIWPWGSSS